MKESGWGAGGWTMLKFGLACTNWRDTEVGWMGSVAFVNVSSSMNWPSQIFFLICAGTVKPNRRRFRKQAFSSPSCKSPAAAPWTICCWSGSATWMGSGCWFCGCCGPPAAAGMIRGASGGAGAWGKKTACWAALWSLPLSKRSRRVFKAVKACWISSSTGWGAGAGAGAGAGSCWIWSSPEEESESWGTRTRRGGERLLSRFWARGTGFMRPPRPRGRPPLRRAPPWRWLRRGMVWKHMTTCKDMIISRGSWTPGYRKSKWVGGWRGNNPPWLWTLWKQGNPSDWPIDI